ncbi:MAG: DUF2087 domain-containing protein [Anaerolineae bacterium]
MSEHNQAQPIDKYLDGEGRVTRWPLRKNKQDQDIVLAYLATKFEPGRVYTEIEVNEVLKQYHTFNDWAVLRRELFERGMLNRSKDGAEYWVTPKTKIY